MKKVIPALLFALAFNLAFAEKAEPFMFIPAEKDGPFPVALWLHGY